MSGRLAQRITGKRTGQTNSVCFKESRGGKQTHGASNFFFFFLLWGQRDLKTCLDYDYFQKAPVESCVHE